MKRRLTLTLAMCLGAFGPGCGDDTESDTDALGGDAGGDDDADDDLGDDDVADDDADDDLGDDDVADDDADDDVGDDDAADDDGDEVSDAGGDDDVSGDDAGPTADAGAPEPTPGFLISSPNFEDGDALPSEYTCEGEPFGSGYSPELAWEGAPEGTLSYALVFKDLSLLPDAPQFAYHWAAWNIPASVSGIPEHMSIGQFPEELEGGEQFRAGPPHDIEFFGPCPSWQTLCFGYPRVTDSYSFSLYAFDVAELVPPEQGDAPNYVAILGDYFAINAIGWTEVNATSDAAPSSGPMCPADAGAGDAGSAPVSGDGGVAESGDASTGDAGDAG